ncbi:hypothetical protein F511_21838 [Dorcoceras hygrometricum]|uniref:Dystroglycan-like n=1 Tax=Dorcoceras hygrometricum TaxID=472368 RepID=A0A2Z7C323_9LAMI|nr:hypothetical protein F511_21838 [Dorcoceras hygrometricum]
MESSLIANALQVNFDSVLIFPEEGMVNMFKALESTGLCGFLGCPSILYEQDLEQFFSVAFVKENEVISAVQGKFIGISEEIFAGAFGLPIPGLTDLSDVPKDFVYDERSIFSASGEPVKTSCKKMEMKFEFRLPNDILPKSVTVKAGSFDAVTHERFLLMMAIHFGMKINWSRIMFDIFKDMMTKSSKQVKGFAAQNCVLLKVKTVGTYIAKNKKITADEDEPVETVAKKAATRRPASVVVEPATKKKRTTVGRAAPAEKNLDLVTVGQDVEPISMIPSVVLETTEVEDVETDLEEPVVMKTAGVEPIEKESRIDVITNYDEDSSLKVLSNEEGPLVEMEKEKEKEKEKDKGKSVAQMLDSTDTEPLSKVLELTEKSTSDEESMSLDDILKRIPEEMMLPSFTAAEPTKITFESRIEIRERDWYKESLPQITVSNKGKAPLVAKDEIKGHLAREMFTLICADIEFLVQIREKVIE